MLALGPHRASRARDPQRLASRDVWTPDDLPPSRLLAVDVDYLRRVVVEMCDIPSPTGRTDHITQYVGERLIALGLDVRVTRRGALVADLEGERSGTDRAITCHVDTIGCMVTALKDNGRLALRPVGTHSARFAEGVDVRVFVDDLKASFGGTVLPLKASGHRYDTEVDTQGVGWDDVEVRLDAPVWSAQDLWDAGVRVGDFVALESRPRITGQGFVRARHLDDKAGVACVLAATKALLESGLTLPVSAHLFITNTEEVGHGASGVVDADVAELVSVDNAVVAPQQQSREDAVNVAVADSTGPFDYHLTRRLLGLCREHSLLHARDVFRYYRSDLAAAVEAGANTRTALIGVGVDASHGHERTHVSGMERVARLLTAYLQTPLVFQDWDERPAGDLSAFPSLAVQPADDEGPREGPLGVA